MCSRCSDHRLRSSTRGSFVVQRTRTLFTDSSPTTQLKRTMSSTGFKQRWSTESQSVLPYGSRRPYTSVRKDNRPWTVMRAATNWAAHTTAFLTRRLPVVSSRAYRKNWVPASSNEVSGRGRNVKFQVIILVVFDEFNKEMMMSILCTTW